MKNLHLLEFSAEAFRCHVYHHQCLSVLVKLVVMMLAIWFIEGFNGRYVSTRMAGICVCVKERVVGIM